MPLNWMLHPALPLAVAALCLTLALVLFLSLKRDLQVAEKRWAGERQSLLTAIAQLRGAASTATVEDTPAVESVPVTGMNPNRRAQALRMSRSGERPDLIAASLGVPPREIELLLKVHRLTLQ